MKRDYSNKPKHVKTKSGSGILINCPVPNCNRKYKTEVKLKAHVEKTHYYETRRGNAYFRFDLKTKSKVYDLAANYTQLILYDMDDTHDSTYLLPQVSATTDDDYNRISIAHTSFIANVKEANILFACDWDQIMDDFQKFLGMGLPYYDTNFCPTLPIDFLWHALMSDRQLYKDVCFKACGETIPHCAIERTEEEDAHRFSYFKDVFKHMYGREPYGTTTLIPGSIVTYFQKKAQQIKDEIDRQTRLEKEQVETQVINTSAWYPYYISSSQVYGRGSSC